MSDMAVEVKRKVYVCNIYLHPSPPPHTHHIDNTVCLSVCPGITPTFLLESRSYFTCKLFPTPGRICFLTHVSFPNQRSYSRTKLSDTSNISISPLFRPCRFSILRFTVATVRVSSSIVSLLGLYAAGKGWNLAYSAPAPPPLFFFFSSLFSSHSSTLAKPGIFYQYNIISSCATTLVYFLLLKPTHNDSTKTFLSHSFFLLSLFRSSFTGLYAPVPP